MQTRQTDGSQTVKAGGFLQFVQRRFLLVFLAIVVGVSLAFFSFQFWIGDTPVVPGKVFSLTSENTIIKDFQVISTDPLAYYAILSDLDSNEEYVIWNGREGERYQEIESLTTSSNESHIAYMAVDGDRHVLVYDNKEVARHEAINEIALSPNGKSVAYIAGEQCVVNEDDEEKDCERYRAVLDGNEQAPYEHIEHIRFSPDNKKVAYIAQEGIESFIIQNGERIGNTYISIRDFLFLPDSQDLVFNAQDFNLAYIAMFQSQEEQREDLPPPVATDSEAYRNTIGDREVTEETFEPEFEAEIDEIEDEDKTNRRKMYDNIVELTLSADGSRLAYIAEEQGETFLVVDEIEQKHYVDSEIKAIAFSPDSQRLAYVVQDEVQSFAVVNGKEGEPFPNVVEIVFSANGQLLAYRVIDEVGKHAVVIDGKQGERYEFVRNLVFSPDNEHLAYKAQVCEDPNTQSRCQEFIVLDGQELEGADKVSAPVFAEDSQKVLYLAIKQGEVSLKEYAVQ